LQQQATKFSTLIIANPNSGVRSAQKFIEEAKRTINVFNILVPKGTVSDQSQIIEMSPDSIEASIQVFNVL